MRDEKWCDDEMANDGAFLDCFECGGEARGCSDSAAVGVRFGS